MYCSSKINQVQKSIIFMSHSLSALSRCDLKALWGLWYILHSKSSYWHLPPIYCWAKIKGVFWESGHAVIQPLLWRTFYFAFWIYLLHTPYICLLGSLPHCLSLSNGHDIVTRLVCILSAPMQSPSSHTGCPPACSTPKLLLPLPPAPCPCPRPGSSFVTTSNYIRWKTDCWWSI